MNRLVLAFFIYSVLGLCTMPAYARFVVMQDELWATNAAIHAAISSGDTALSNQVAAVAGLMAVETASRAAGDSLGSNHVHSVELALSNRLDSVESALTGASNDLAQAISTETQNRIAGDSANHNEIVGVQEYAESVSNKVDSAVYAMATNLHTKVSTNHFGDVTIHGGIVVTDNIYMGEGKNLVLTDELDPYWAAVSNEVTKNAVKGSTAYGWGDHSLVGYLLAEQDLAWTTVSNTVTQNSVKGSTAYGWGDHAAIGYLTNELDPYWASVSDMVTQNAGQGSTAYGWGDHKLAGYANTNGSIYVRGNVTATSFIGDGSQLSGIQVDDKVSTNHVGDVEIAGNVSATSFTGDGSQLSGISGGLEFPELTIYSSGATTSIPFTKDYKYYQVVVTNSTDVSFDYSGIGDFTGSVLEFQIRIRLVNPGDAVTIPADGVAGLKYVGDIDITATIANTVQHLGMLMYSTNNVLLSHWFFDEP